MNKVTSYLKFEYVAVFLLMVLVYLLVFLPSESMIYVTQEDGLIEYLTALCFLISSLLCFTLFVKGRFRDGEYQERYQSYRQRLFFLLLALVLFCGFGEEISWGQRIFGFGTPELFMEHNVQKEFNIHNLRFFNLWEDIETEERKEGWKSLFTMKRLFVMSFLSYLLLVPLLSMVNRRFRKLMNTLYVPVPPIWLGLFFLINIFMYRFFKELAQSRGFHNHGVSELEEFNFSILLLILPLLWTRIPFLTDVKLGRAKQ